MALLNAKMLLSSIVHVLHVGFFASALLSEVSGEVFDTDWWERLIASFQKEKTEVPL